MDIYQTIILSLIEGVTEFIPVSSTGHLILASEILKIPQTEFIKSFEIIIQLGAILSVVFLYYKDLLNKALWPKILIAFLPSMAVGGLLYPFIKGSLIGNSLITVTALLIGGLAFIFIEYIKKDEQSEIKIEKLSYKNSLIIGLFQSISVIPGVSRAGATILGSYLLGVNRQDSAKFSFILAVPTMAAATALDVFKTRLSFSQSELYLLLTGFVLSFLFALIAVKLFVRFLGNHNFTAFGIYRIVLAILFYLIFLR